MSHDVRSELPATVLEVYRPQHADVAAGDALLLLESMKMEIPVLCEVGGTVGSVHVSAGDTVSAGDLMVRIVAGRTAR